MIPSRRLQIVRYLTVFVALAALSVACAEVGPSPVNNPPTNSTTATDFEGPDDSEQGTAITTGLEPVELTMFYPVVVAGPLQNVMEDLLADFEVTHPNITVNAEFVGAYDDVRTRTIEAVEEGEPVHVALMYSIDVFEMIQRDLVVPLDNLVTSDDDTAWLNSFYTSLSLNGTVGGRTWGVPFQRSTIVLYYNRDAFRRSGLDPLDPPSNWDELVEYGKALTTEDGSQWGLMVPSSGFPYWMFGAFAWQNGQRLMNETGTATFFDAPGSVKALEFWRSLGATHGIMPSGIVEWDTLTDRFIDGEAAMMWHSTGNLTAVRTRAEFDFGVAMLPRNTQRGTPTGGGNLYILNRSTEAEQAAAFKLVRFLTSPERSAEWSIATGYMGISPAAYQTPKLSEYVDQFPHAAVARDQLEFATAELATFSGESVRAALDLAIQQTLLGEASPANALRVAQERAEAELAPYAG